jgi:hypothetical protein
METRRKLREEKDFANKQYLSIKSKLDAINCLLVEYKHCNKQQVLSANPYTLINKIDYIVNIKK